MIRRLFRFLFGKGVSPVVSLADYAGDTYRQQLLRALVRLDWQIAKGEASDEVVKEFHGILKDLGDLEHGADRAEVHVFKEQIEKLEDRVRLLEGLLGSRRVEASVGPRPGRIA